MKRYRPRRTSSAVPTIITIGAVLLGMLVIVVLLAVASRENRVDRPVDPELTAKRLEAIKGFQAAGMLGNVHTRAFACDVEITPKFYLAKFDHKQAMVKVVWAWAFDGKSEPGLVYLKDMHSGKEAGRFNGISLTME